MSESIGQDFNLLCYLFASSSVAVTPLRVRTTPPIAVKMFRRSTLGLRRFLFLQ
jgi:hypothetical protein